MKLTKYEINLLIQKLDDDLDEPRKVTGGRLLLEHRSLRFKASCTTILWKFWRRIQAIKLNR